MTDTFATCRRVIDGELVATTGAPGGFPLYSVTKTVLATQVLMLVADRRLSLTDPVSRWLPTLAHADQITVDQLLRHSSGLPDYGGEPAYAAAVADRSVTPWTDDRYFRLVQDRGLRFSPGTGFAYSNIGYLAVRRIIEAICSEDWAAAVRRMVIAPLGLTRTAPAVHPNDLEPLVPHMEGYHPGWVSHGLLTATMTDAAALMTGCLGLSPPLLVPQKTGHRPLTELGLPGRPLHPVPAYGRGVMGSPHPVRLGGREVELIGHSGGGPAAVAAVYAVRDVATESWQVIAAAVCSESEEAAEALVLAHLQPDRGEVGRAEYGA